MQTFFCLKCSNFCASSSNFHTYFKLFFTVLSWRFIYMHFPYLTNSIKAMHFPGITALTISHILISPVFNSTLKSKSTCCFLFCFECGGHCQFYCSDLFLDFYSPHFCYRLKNAAYYEVLSSYAIGVKQNLLYYLLFLLSFIFITLYRSCLSVHITKHCWRIIVPSSSQLRSKTSSVEWYPETHLFLISCS